MNKNRENKNNGQAYASEAAAQLPPCDEVQAYCDFDDPFAGYGTQPDYDNPRTPGVNPRTPQPAPQAPYGQPSPSGNGQPAEKNAKSRWKAVWSYIRRINYLGILAFVLYLIGVNSGEAIINIVFVFASFICSIMAYVKSPGHTLNIFAYFTLIISTLLQSLIFLLIIVLLLICI